MLMAISFLFRFLPLLLYGGYYKFDHSLLRFHLKAILADSESKYNEGELILDIFHLYQEKEWIFIFPLIVLLKNSKHFVSDLTGHVTLRIKLYISMSQVE